MDEEPIFRVYTRASTHRAMLAMMSWGEHEGARRKIAAQQVVDQCDEGHLSTEPALQDVMKQLRAWAAWEPTTR